MLTVLFLSARIDIFEYETILALNQASGASLCISNLKITFLASYTAVLINSLIDLESNLADYSLNSLESKN